MPSKWMEAYMKRKYDDHRKRIKEAKSTIDSARPPEMPMSMRREAERRREQVAIEKDNRLLMDRLAVAMSSKNIDNDLKVKPFTSYIELQRKKELKKIMLENSRMLDRIQNTVPTYRHIEWELDAEKRVEYLRNMTEFPDLFVPPGSSQKPRLESRQSQRSSQGMRNPDIQNNSPFRSQEFLERSLEGPQPPLPLPMQQHPTMHNFEPRRPERPILLPHISANK